MLACISHHLREIFCICVPMHPRSSLGKVLKPSLRDLFGASKNRLHSFFLEAGEKYRLKI